MNKRIKKKQYKRWLSTIRVLTIEDSVYLFDKTASGVCRGRSLTENEKDLLMFHDDRSCTNLLREDFILKAPSITKERMQYGGCELAEIEKGC